MSSSKPRLAIVSSHNICCALAYYADALKEFLTPIFDVQILDLKTTQLLRQEGNNYLKMSEEHIDQLCIKLSTFDVVNVHLELGIFGTSVELIVSRILKLCRASGRLIFTVHTIDYKGASTEHAYAYQKIINSLKQRPQTNPFYLITHLPQETDLIKNIYKIDNIMDFPLIYLTNERRNHFRQTRNPDIWKKQFGFQNEDIIIGMFGLISPHKNYLHALRTLRLLPSNYKLLIIGEAHHMSIKEWQVDPIIQEMMSHLDAHPVLADRVVFAGSRDDSKYYEDLANIDFVLLPSFEVGQTGSATFSNALELSCAILKSNTMNRREYEKYFPNCFESFDIGNQYETKHKILHFDKEKIMNLKNKINQFSEIQLREMYLKIYDSMKECNPVDLSTSSAKIQDKIGEAIYTMPSKPLIKKIFKSLPLPLQTWLKKIRNDLRTPR